MRALIAALLMRSARYNVLPTPLPLGLPDLLCVLEGEVAQHV